MENDLIINRAGLKYKDANYGEVAICKKHILNFGKKYSEYINHRKCYNPSHKGKWLSSTTLQPIDLAFSNNLLRNNVAHIPRGQYLCKYCRTTLGRELDQKLAPALGKPQRMDQDTSFESFEDPEEEKECG